MWRHRVAIQQKEGMEVVLRGFEELGTPPGDWDLGLNIIYISLGKMPLCVRWGSPSVAVQKSWLLYMLPVEA